MSEQERAMARAIYLAPLVLLAMELIRGVPIKHFCSLKCPEPARTAVLNGTWKAALWSLHPALQKVFCHEVRVFGGPLFYWTNWGKFRLAFRCKAFFIRSFLCVCVQAWALVDSPHPIHFPLCKQAHDAISSRVF